LLYIDLTSVLADHRNTRQQQTKGGMQECAPIIIILCFDRSMGRRTRHDNNSKAAAELVL
jgi:hypothetical protein